MSSFEVLHEITILLRRGRSPKYTEETSTLVLNQKCIRDYRCNYDLARFHDAVTKPIPAELMIRRGDVLVNSTGVGTLGRVAPIRSEPLQPSTVDSHITILRPDPSKIDPEYFGWSIVAQQATIEAMGEGATGQTELSARRLGAEIELWLPSLATQRRIASVLGAYDDLIEVNRRRIAVLEEMARGVFEEWFVRFRFPGHEAVPILDTPDGPLPEGWNWDRIGDVATYVNRGIAPKYDNEAETLVISQKCIRDQRLSLLLARKQSKNVPSEKVVQPGDVLINSTGTGTLGRVAQAGQVPPGVTVDSHVTIVRPGSPDDRDYLGLSLFAMQPVFEHMGAGSTNQTELARSAVQNQMLIWPPVDLRARFGGIVRPMRELIEQLAYQNAKLSASRDLLLPRLISGQLSVDDATRQLDEAA